MPRAALAHVRQEADDQLHSAEVVELDRAFEVVEAVVAERDRATDRAPRVVDEHVDVAVVGEHPLEQSFNRLDVGQVGRVDVGGTAGGDDLGAHLLEVLDAARDQQGHAARCRDLQCGRAPDPGGGARDQHVASAEGLLERAPAAQIGVHLALPVVPQARDILLQRRWHLKRRAGERAAGFVGVEPRHELHVREHLPRDPELA